MLSIFGNISHELKAAFRACTKRPGHTALVVTVLAAGLACVMFMLVIIDSMIIRPLPFDRDGSMLNIGISEQSQPGQIRNVSGHDLLEWQSLLKDNATLAGYYSNTINLSDMETPERFKGARVTPGLLRLLGTNPILGRDFAEADTLPGAPPVVLLSWSLWQSRYGGQPNIVGQQIRMNAAPATVIGVMPRDFSFPFREEIWALDVPRPGMSREESSNFEVIARVAPGAMATVDARLAGWYEQARQEAPDYFQQRAIQHQPLKFVFISKQTQKILGVMLGAVVLVLLIACANTANLPLTRSASRRQELSVRVALGASGRRLALHLLAHSLLLSLIAMVLALPLAMAGTHWMQHMFAASEEGPPEWMRLDFDWRVLGIALLAAVLTALISGAYPAWNAARSGIAQTMRQGGRSATGGAFAAGSRWLVAGELAMSCILLITAGSMVVGVVNFIHSDIGVNTDHRLTARVGLVGPEFDGEEAKRTFYERISERLLADPDVLDATVSSVLPGLIGDDRTVIPAAQLGDNSAMTNTRLGSVDTHFFDTFDIKLQRGRLFDQRDGIDAVPVAVVDTTFAQRLSPDGDVIGKRFVIDPDDDETPTTYTVVGVTSPLQLDDVDDRIEPSMLVPLVQQTPQYASIIVHTRADEMAFAPRLRALVREVQPDLPIYWVKGYDQVIYEATVGEHFLAKIFSVLGIIAVVLAAAGLYGVIAFSVTQRTREIGIRRALGAPRSRLVRGLLRTSFWQVVVGIVVGVGLGIPFAGLLAGLIENMQAPVVAISVVATTLMLVVALLASLLPARRALDIEPTVALRHE